MVIRLISCGVLIAGAALFSAGCRSTAEARNTPSTQEGQASQKDKPQCTGNEPGYNYVSREPAQCPAILFTCPSGASPFFNDCGCGCQTACNYEDPARTYVSRDSARCAAIRFTCEPGKAPFFNDCGCGCEPAP